MRNYLFLLVLVLVLSNCKKERFYFSKENSCAAQIKNRMNNNKKSIYFFDSKGMMDEAMYDKSPSNILKNELRKNVNFIKYASKTFDFFVFDQTCTEGRVKFQNFNILNVPTILLVDENEKVLLKKVGLTSSENLISEIENTLKEK